MLRGFTLDEAIQMIERLKDAAAIGRQAHLSLGEAVVTATEGLKNENSVLVDNAGVTKNVSQMWKEYAESLGKSVFDLTLAEKRQAEFNGIMKETEVFAGAAAKQVEIFQGKTSQLGTIWDMVKAKLGDALKSAILPALDGLISFMGTLLDVVSRNEEAISAFFKEMIAYGLQAAIALVEGFGKAIAVSGAWGYVQMGKGTS